MGPQSLLGCSGVWGCWLLQAGVMQLARWWGEAINERGAQRAGRGLDKAGRHLGLQVLGGSSPAAHEPWCSTDLRDVQGLGSTGLCQGEKKGRWGGMSQHWGGFTPPFCPAWAVPEAGVGCCPVAASGLPPGCL